jgi:hypothetical protein
MEEREDLAKESIKTKRAREKLQKQIEENDRQITQDALEKKVKEIQNWIMRHSNQRVILKDKTFDLFDENQNAAEESSKILTMAEELKKKLDL